MLQLGAARLLAPRSCMIRTQLSMLSVLANSFSALQEGSREGADWLPSSKEPPASAPIHTGSYVQASAGIVWNSDNTNHTVIRRLCAARPCSMEEVQEGLAAYACIPQAG